MLPKQFKQICKLSDGARKRKVVERFREENDAKRTKQGIILPKEWYEMRQNYSVIGMVTSERPTKRSLKYQRLQDQYERFGQFCKPLVVSANKFVLDGFMVLFLAKNLGINELIPFITLENVIVNL